MKGGKFIKAEQKSQELGRDRDSGLGFAVAQRIWVENSQATDPLIACGERLKACPAVMFPVKTRH